MGDTCFQGKSTDNLTIEPSGRLHRSHCPVVLSSYKREPAYQSRTPYPSEYLNATRPGLQPRPREISCPEEEDEAHPGKKRARSRQPPTTTGPTIVVSDQSLGLVWRCKRKSLPRNLRPDPYLSPWKNEIVSYRPHSKC